MNDYREILRLHSLGSSQRCIARELQCSRDTVAEVIHAAEAAGIGWPLDEDVTSSDIREVLFPWKKAREQERESTSPYVLPDYQWVHNELAKKGVTLTLLWDEYCSKVRSSGGVPYMYTQFCEKYRRWARITKATMRIAHKPGEAMQVDWAGDPLIITDSTTGELSPAYIFVAVLPCSMYTYAEACSDMKQENWLVCHAHAYRFFGGVTRLLVPDNCRTATTSNNRYETILNRSYQEMAEHYGTAIVPARVRKPDDKAAAEGTVRFVSTWITAALRDRKFFSVSEAQSAVQEKLRELNQRPFRKPHTGNRLSAFEQEEKPFLQPLPSHDYEPAVWISPKVGYDYLVSDGVNKYSVPYDLIGEKVDVRLTKCVVEVFYRQTRVAAHVRAEKEQRDPIVKPEHMPEAHRKYLSYNAEEFTAWAQKIGSKTAQVAAYFLHSGKECEQGYKFCASLTKMEKQYGAECLEDACERVLRLSTVPTIRNISALCKSSSTLCKPSNIQSRSSDKSVMKSSADNNACGKNAEISERNGITRGAAYYSKGWQSTEKGQQADEENTQADKENTQVSETGGQNRE